MMPKGQTGRINDLLASATGDLVDDSPQLFQDNAIRVERILLELIRPDPVQPRRVLPERIHFAFHNQQLTPTQSLRELVQLVQIAARQRGRPFNNVLELLPRAESQQEEAVEEELSPEERLLKELVTLAITMRDDGQVNPISVIDISEGVTRLYRIETGERRYWASWLLRDFIPEYSGDGMIPCIVVSADRSTVFRQAHENTARAGLPAVAMARQAALLLLAVHQYEIPNYAVKYDFYRQALTLRLPRGEADEIYSAMGGIDKRRFSQYKELLRLSDEALELADRYQLDERVLRHVIALPPPDHAEMVQQIIQFNLTSRQVEAILNQGAEVADNSPNDLPAYAVKFARMLIRDMEKQDPDTLWLAVCREQGDQTMAQAYLKRWAQLALKAAEHLTIDD